ncbi:MAG: PD40 domain-containing protein [Armatimonadetes bacterium]|nr:PD40 domain-containing protein [Armatimonadota bacterium]
MIKLLAPFAITLAATVAHAQFPSYPNIDLVARGNGDCTSPSISSNGNLIAFYSEATNLATGASVPSIQVYNVSAGTYELASPGLTGGVSRPFISRDGLYVVFYGSSTSTTSAVPRVYNLTTHSLSSISVTSTLMSVDDTVDAPSISDATGGTRYVAYKELAPTVIKGGTVPPQIRVYNMSTSASVQASLVGTTKANNSCWFPVINSDGTRLAFVSSASNLVSGVSGQQVYYSQYATGAWNVTASTSGSLGTVADWPSISSNGLRVAFESNTGPSTFTEVYLWGTTFAAFQPYPSNPAPAGTAKYTGKASISPDGQYICMISDRGLDPYLDNVDLYWDGYSWVPVGLASCPYTYVCDTSTGTCTLLSYRVSTNKKARVGDFGAVSNYADSAAFFTGSDRVYDSTYPSYYEIYLRH